MKLTALVMLIAMVTAVVWARDLPSLARKERARRETIQSRGETARTFTNADLDGFPDVAAPDKAEVHSIPARLTKRDLAKEEAFWRGELARHERELARVDANIRRLEWRLRERIAKMKPRAGLREDPAITLMKESLQSLQDERRRLELDFYERARKAGAFPGWLR